MPSAARWLSPIRTPGNLLLNRSLLCKVGDVGLSRLMPGGLRTTAGGSPLPGVSTVMDSRLVGTPCYMDPEYLRTGRFGPKSDVYSLGGWACVCHRRWQQLPEQSCQRTFGLVPMPVRVVLTVCILTGSRAWAKLTHVLSWPVPGHNLNKPFWQLYGVQHNLTC